MKNTDKTKYQCIYCKRYKLEEEFNREHVISRMLGTYENAHVLNNKEVCKCCNDYFDKEIENKVSMDSYEALLRIQHDGKRHNTNRQIGTNRLIITGKNGIFKNLKMFVFSNPDNPEKIQIKADSVVGIIKDQNSHEYDYYNIDSIPFCDKIIKKRISSTKNPIIFFGLKKEDVYKALISKGYQISAEKFVDNLDTTAVSLGESLEAEISCKIDVLLIRLAAKNIFNYLCYNYGKEFVLDKELDGLRNFIRYGKTDCNIMMCINNTRLSDIPDSVDYGHIIGTAWTVTDKLCLVAFVSWYNAITYSFVVKQYLTNQINIEPHNYVCDNKKRKIIEFNNILFSDWPNSKYKLEYIDNNIFKIIHK